MNSSSDKISNEFETPTKKKDQKFIEINIEKKKFFREEGINVSSFNKEEVENDLQKNNNKLLEFL